MVKSVNSNFSMWKKLIVGLVLLIGFTMATEADSPDYLESIDPVPDCKYGTEYNSTTKSCSEPTACPNGSIGIFPNCTCTATNFDYSVSLNTCFRVCPDNSTGYWPNCQCIGDAGFDKNSFKCIHCSSLTVGGIFPNCVCEDENSKFNAYRNYCETCPIDSSGIIPNCVCNDGAGEMKISNAYTFNLTDETVF